MASYLSCTSDEPWILKLIEARHVSNWHCTFKSCFKKLCLVLTCFSIFGSLSDFNNGFISNYYQLRFWAATFFADIWSKIFPKCGKDLRFFWLCSPRPKCNKKALSRFCFITKLDKLAKPFDDTLNFFNFLEGMKCSPSNRLSVNFPTFAASISPSTDT